MKEVQQEVERLNNEILELQKTNQSKESVSTQLKEKEIEKVKQQMDKIQKDSSEREKKLQDEVNMLRKKVEEGSKSVDVKQVGDKSEEIAALQAEVQKWMVSAQQLEQLGTEAVQEVYAELEKERQSKTELMTKYDEEKSKREKAEEEMLISEQKLQQLDGVMQRLMNIKK